MNRKLISALCFVAVCACQTTVTAPSSAPASTTLQQVSLPDAFDAVAKNQDVLTTTVIGKPKSVSTRGLNSRFIFDFRETNQYATLPTSVTVQLAATPAATAIKASGKSVYAFVRPQIEAEKVSLFLNSERNPRYTYQTVNGLLYRERPKAIVNRVQLPNTSRCEGYYVILGPENGYKLQWNFDEEYRIRAFGSRGTDRFYIKSIEDQVTTRTAGAEVSFGGVRSSNSRYRPCYPNAAIKSAW